MRRQLKTSLRVLRGIGRILGFLGLLMCLVAQGWAFAGTQTPKGLHLIGTRIIYPAQATRGITFSVTNNTFEPFLIQSRVTQWPELPQDIATTKEVPFIVTPPLARLNSGETLNLRIRETQKVLPTDRESVFGFHVKGIPSQSEQPESGSSTVADSSSSVQMVLALQYTLKLFYRPASLPVYDAQLIAESLQFTREGEQLVVKNPSAFYVTLDSLSFEDQQIDADALFEMIPPFGQQAYRLPTSKSQGKLTWRIINELGKVTIQCSRILTTSESLPSVFASPTQKTLGE